MAAQRQKRRDDRRRKNSMARGRGSGGSSGSLIYFCSLRRDKFLPKTVAQQHFLQEFLLVLRRGHEVRIDWQAQRESRALAVLAARVNSPPMMVHNEITSHQMNAIFHRTIASHDKRIEYQPQCFFWQARSVIAELHLNGIFAGGRIIEPRR